jgi:hypothetical protein
MIVATEDLLDKIPDDDTSVIVFRKKRWWDRFSPRIWIYRSSHPGARKQWLRDLYRRKPGNEPANRLEGRV